MPDPALCGQAGRHHKGDGKLVGPAFDAAATPSAESPAVFGNSHPALPLTGAKEMPKP
jgi:hypothetical protein